MPIVKFDITERGINLHQDVTKIDDNELAFAKNMCPVKPGMLQMRPSAVLTNQTGSIVIDAVSDTLRIMALIPVLYKTWPAHYVYLVEHLDLNGVRQNVFIRAGNIGSPEVPLNQVVSTSVGDAIPSWFFYNDRLFITTGSGKMVIVQQTPDFSALELGTGNYEGQFLVKNPSTGAYISDYVFTPPITAGCATLYRSHAVYGNLGAGFENALLMSGDSDPLYVDDSPGQPMAANGRYFTVGANDDAIVALREVAQTGTGNPTSAALLVLKQRSAYIVTGLPGEPGTSDIGDLTVSRLAEDCGCIAPLAVVQTPRGIVWPSQDDIYVFNVGQVPYRIGTKIRPVITQENTVDAYNNWHGCYADGFYRLAVRSDGSASTCQEQYWLDLHNGLPTDANGASWWGPMVYKMSAPVYDVYHTDVYTTSFVGTWCLGTLLDGTPMTLIPSGTYPRDTIAGADIVAATLNGSTGHDCDIDYEWAPAWLASHAYNLGDLAALDGQMFQCSTAGTSSSGAGPVYSTAYLITDGTVVWSYVGSSYVDTTMDGGFETGIETYIDVELRTKSYDFDEPMCKKIVQGAELDIYTSATQYVEWDVFQDQGAAESLDHEELIVQQNYETGLLVLNTNSPQRILQPIWLKPSATERITGSDVQFRIRNRPGWAVKQFYNRWVMLSGGTSPFVTWPVKLAAALTPGFYADFNALVDQFVTKANVVLGFIGKAIGANGYRARGGVWHPSAASGAGTWVGISSKTADISFAAITADEIHRSAEALGLEKETQYIQDANIANGPVIAEPRPMKQAAVWAIGDISFKIVLIPRRPD